MNIVDIKNGKLTPEAVEQTRAKTFRAEVTTPSKGCIKQWLLTPDVMLVASNIEAVALTDPTPPSTTYSVSCFITSGNDLSEYVVFESTLLDSAQAVFFKLRSALLGLSDGS